MWADFEDFWQKNHRSYIRICKKKISQVTLVVAREGLDTGVRAKVGMGGSVPTLYVGDSPPLCLVDFYSYAA